MSLLVHELLIGTGGGGGGGNGASNLQTSPSTPVPIASVTVTHSNSTVQVAHLQQSRVVTITSSQSRLTPSDKGSRLADALAGNPPYSYSSNTSQPQLIRSHPPSRPPISHILSSSGIPNPAHNLKPLKTLSSRHQSYALPFVLQDHNYGAPPPPTPPHSPPPPPPATNVSSSAIPYSYKVHQIFPSNSPTPTTPTKVNNNIPSYSPSKTQNQFAKITSEQSILTINNIGAVQISSTSNGGAVGTSSSPSVTSHIMASMPLHRQQFMPHPKTPIYPSPNLAPVSVCDTLLTPSVSLPCIGGQDTDEESRLSDRSSSVGPSGEETETAPEGEGEEQVQADDSITRCICNFTHDDGYMIQCDRCFVWQHVDCMEIDRDNIPDEYLCEACKPRLTDKSKARALQVRRRQEIRAHLARVSSSDSEDNSISSRSKTTSSGKSQDRKVLKKKKPKSCKENKNNRRQSLTTSKSSVLNLTSNNTIKSTPSVEERDSKPSVVKSRRRQSSMTVSNHGSGEESCSNTVITLEQLRSWIEDYEVAVTNHYSPELRAKVHAARINGISAEFRESTQGALLGHRCRVAPCYDAGLDSLEDKILVAATRLEEGTAIIEYQGKYTLKSQWSCASIPPGLPYLPFVLQYNMLKEGLSVCVDARTYGNDARFARRSSQFNAEIRHVVERGSVHLYIVACKEIEEEEEIVLPLETSLCQQTVLTKPNFAQTNLNKTDGNENLKEEPVKIPPLNTCNPQIRKNGLLQSSSSSSNNNSNNSNNSNNNNNNSSSSSNSSSKKSVRKPLLTLALPQPLNRTSRRATSSDGYSCDDLGSPPQQQQSMSSPTKQRRVSGCGGAGGVGGGSRSPVKCPLKSPPSKSPLKEDSSSGESPQQESPIIDGHKMTREERKIAAYMKAFERMEKAEQRRQEMEKRRGEEKGGKRQSLTEDEDGGRNDSADEGTKDCRKGKSSKEIPLKQDFYEDDNNGSSSEGERMKIYETALQGYNSPPSGGNNVGGFRFPKTKKALMNEWLNETIDPVLHSSFGGEIASGVPTCYMRSPSTPMRKGGNSASTGTTMAVVEMVGRSAKKRWLRQAIIDETEPQGVGFSLCSSPNSRPDSPTGGDYITPLKKRRLARESMSSEQSNTPPSTPVHPGMEEKYNEELEMDHVSYASLDLDEERKAIKMEEKDFKESLLMNADVKQEGDPDCYSGEDSKADIIDDRLSIDISKISVDLKPQLDNVTFEEGRTKEESPPIKVEAEENSETALEMKVEEKQKPDLVPDSDLLIEESELVDNVISTVTKVEKVENEEMEERVSPSWKPSVKKSRKRNVKRDSGKKFKSLDKNRNMQQIRKVPPKLRRRPKAKKLHDRKTNHLKSDSLSPEVGSHQSPEKDPAHVPTSVQDRSLSDLPPKDPAPESPDQRPQSEERRFDLNKGPKTPDGTPPETPVKTDPHPRDPQQCVTLDIKTFSDKFESTKDIENQIDQFLLSPGDRSKAKDIEDCQEDSTLKIQSAQVSEIRDEHSPSKIEQSPSISIRSNVDPVKPAAVKRKLSILEYRKRKSISCEREPKEESLPSVNPGLRSVSIDSPMNSAATDTLRLPIQYPIENLKRQKTSKGLLELDAPPTSCLQEIIPYPLSPLSPTSIVTFAMKMEKGKTDSVAAAAPLPCPSPSSTSSSTTTTTTTTTSCTSAKDSKEVKWNAAPTLLEQQRENLTARLRREFGLCLPEDNQSKLKLGGDKSIKEKWTDIDKKRFATGKKLPLSPSFGITGSNSFPSTLFTKALKVPPSTSNPSNTLLHSVTNPSTLPLSECKSAFQVSTPAAPLAECVSIPTECDSQSVIDPPHPVLPLPRAKLPPLPICTTSDFQSVVQCEFSSLTGAEVEGQNITS